MNLYNLDNFALIRKFYSIQRQYTISTTSKSSAEELLGSYLPLIYHLSTTLSTTPFEDENAYEKQIFDCNVTESTTPITTTNTIYIDRYNL